MNIALVQPNTPYLTNERVHPNIGLIRVATQLKADKHKYFNKPRFTVDDSFYKDKYKQSKTDIRTNELSNQKLIKLRNIIDNA